MSSSRTRKAIEEVQGGAQLAHRSASKADGTILIPDVLPKKKAYSAFGFNHVGSSGDGSDEIVIVGDNLGLIAAVESLSATAFDTAIGCLANANLNKQIESRPVAIDKISLEWSDTTQKSKSIQYAVLQPDGQVDIKDVTPYIRSQKSKNAEQLTVDEAEFQEPILLSDTTALIFYVGDTKTLEAILHPVAGTR